MNIYKRIMYSVLGVVLIIIGVIGLALPIFPTVPFIIGALFCFMKVSRKLSGRIKGSAFYKKHIEKYRKNSSGKALIALYVLLTAAGIFAVAVAVYYIRKYLPNFPYINQN